MSMTKAQGTSSGRFRVHPTAWSGSAGLWCTISEAGVNLAQPPAARRRVNKDKNETRRVDFIRLGFARNVSQNHAPARHHQHQSATATWAAASNLGLHFANGGIPASPGLPAAARCQLPAVFRRVHPVALFGLAWMTLGAVVSAQAAQVTAVSNSPSLSRSAEPGPWRFSASVGVKEAIDDNVLLQNVTSNAWRQSLVTTVNPKAGIRYEAAPNFIADLSYGPEVNIFHSESTEDFVLHRFALGLKGKAEGTQWEIGENLVWIDGSEVGPSFFGPGGAPAAGGPQIRDRREALIQRGWMRLRRDWGRWFVRPTIAGYLHDFRAQHRADPGYLNFVDRDDLNGGLDIGFRTAPEAWLTGGYRYGSQHQAELLGNPVHYDSTYHRIVWGVEGRLASWLRLNVALGPEFRRYGDDVAPAFERQNELYLFVDATMTAQVSKADTLALSIKRFEQPGFAGRSTYLDTTYDATWKHNWTAQLSTAAGFRAYNTEFIKPANRNDWIFTPSVAAAYTFSPNWEAEVSYVYDVGESLIPDTEGREYQHQLIAVGVRWKLQ